MTQVGTDRELYGVEAIGAYELDMGNSSSHVRPRERWTFLLDEEGTEIVELTIIILSLVGMVAWVVARALGYDWGGLQLLGTPILLFIALCPILGALQVIEGFLTRRLKREKVIPWLVHGYVILLMLLPLAVTWVARALGYVDDQVVLLAGTPVWLAGLFCFLAFIVDRLRRWLWVKRARRWAATGRPDNLRGADLRGMDLTGVDLGASEEGGKGANLAGANLRGSNLTSANLQAANLRDANLSAANLRSANLRDADLRDADLQWASLVGADLRGAKLKGCSLWHTKYDNTTRWPEGFNPRRTKLSMWMPKAMPTNRD